MDKIRGLRTARLLTLVFSALVFILLYTTNWNAEGLAEIFPDIIGSMAPALLLGVAYLAYNIFCIPITRSPLKLFFKVIFVTVCLAFLSAYLFLGSC